MRRICYYVLLAIMMAGCTRSSIDDVVIGKNGKRISATIESRETKVQLNGDLKTAWTEGDRILVLGNKKIAYYDFDGETGDRSGTFSMYGTPGSVEAYDFGSDLFAFYPIQQSPSLSITRDGNSLQYFWMTVNAVQNYVEGSYDPNSNLMFGVTTDGGNSFSFKNLLGYLELNFTGTKTVKSIKLTGNKGDERLSGSAGFLTSDYGFYSWGGTAGNEITLDCGEQGVQLSNTPKRFYIALLPTSQYSSNFTNGFTVLLTFADGTTFQKSTSKNIVISRNTIQPMAAVATDGIDWKTCSITFNGAYFAGLEFTGENSVSGNVNWGDGTETNVLQVRSHMYLNEGTHTITASVSDATTVTLASCKGVSSIDLSGF